MEPCTRHQFGPFVLDSQERLLQRGGQSVPLTPKAFDLLAGLVAKPGRLLTKDELLRAVWPDAFVDESNLAYNIFALRKALGDTADDPTYIETVPKRGYRFIAAVTPARDDGRQGDRFPAAGTEAAERAPSPNLASALPRRLRWLAVPLLAACTLYIGAMWWRPFRDEPVHAVPLTSLTGVVRSPSLSPDSNYVVFSWSEREQGNPDIYVQQAGSGSPLQLTTHASNDYSPSWSPDGRNIAFLRRAAAEPLIEVRLIPPLGGPERKLADIQPRLPLYRPISLSWCPDSRCVVVTDSPGVGKADAVFTISLDGGHKRQLTFPHGQMADMDPSIAPDGRALIFRRDTTPFSGALYRLALTADGGPDGEPVQLTSTISAGKPTWMSDSREVLFPFRGALWRLAAQPGSTPVKLAFVGQDGSSPDISRTDARPRRLVYVRSFSDGNIWRVDTTAPGAPASSPAVLSLASTRGDFIPNLSPDGHWLAFLSDRSGESQIWASTTTGAEARQLTTIAFRSSPGFPRWSPDGRWVAFHGDPDGRPDVLVVSADGGTPRMLSRQVANAGFPSFSRDGEWIYFTINTAGQGRIWKMPARGGTAAQVTPNQGTLGIESLDGRDLYYVANVNGVSSLWRLPLVGGAPTKVVDGVILGNFDVLAGGIYYIDRISGDAGAHPIDRTGGEARLRYYDFATGQSSTVARNLGRVSFGLTASADGRQVYFSRVDSSVDELMLVENFR